MNRIKGEKSKYSRFEKEMTILCNFYDPGEDYVVVGSHLHNV